MPSFFQKAINKKTYSISTPLIIAITTEYLYTIVDTFFISLIDKENTALLSGPGLIFPLYYIYLSITGSITLGISSVIARGLGEKNKKIIEHTSDTIFAIALLLAILVIIFGYFCIKPILPLLAGTEVSSDAIHYALIYVYYITPGLVALLFLDMFSGVLEGQGNTKHVGIAYTLFIIINILLDPLLIFTFRMGVKGAALASSISITIGLLYILTVYSRDKSIFKINISFRFAKADFLILKEILHIGFPNSLQMAAFGFSQLFFNKYVSSINQASLNAWTLYMRLSSIVLTPALGIRAATIAMIGKAYGKFNLNTIKLIYRSHVIYGFFFVFICAVIFLYFLPAIIPFFTIIPDVLFTSETLGFYLTLLYPLEAATIISIAFFQSIGKPWPGFLIYFVRLIVFPILLTLILTYFFGVNLHYPIISLIIAEIAALCMVFIYSYFYLHNLKFRKVV